MTGPYFVDANIFIYAHDPRDAFKQVRAADWVARLWQERQGRISIQVLSEYYVVATRKLRPRVAPDRAWDHVRTLMAWRPYPIDEAVFNRAREIEQRYRLSWWDSLVVGAAQLQDCTILLTEDLQDGAVFGGVTVSNPFALSVQDSAAVYVVAPAALSRHRPRGRPKRAST